MRSFSLIFSGLLIGLALPVAAFAAGNVLLPSTDSNNDSSYSNLGIVAPPPAPPAPATQPSTPPLTPLPSTSQPAPFTSAPGPSISSFFDAPNSAQLSAGQVPTQVMHVPDISAAIAAQASKSLPYSLTISIDGKSMFGAKDIATLNSKLGLTQEQIPNSCILTVRGILQTTKGPYLIEGPPSPQAAVYYDGMIKNFMMGATAFCSVSQLPQGLGFISETGGRYRVTLQPIVCPAPTRQTSQLIIVYNGTDTAQCTYQ